MMNLSDSKKELMKRATKKGQVIEKQMESINETIFGNFYNISTGKGSKHVPDSRVIQGLANKFKIKTKEVFSEQTDDYAKVVVSASSPNGIYQEDIVIHNFTAILQEKTVSLAEKELKAKKEFESKPMNKEKEFKPVFFNDINNPFELQSNGTIIPNLTLQGQIKIFKDMTRFKTFAARDAYSKAANRAQRRVLNQEFRDEIEIELEDEEVQKLSKTKISKESIQEQTDEFDTDESLNEENNDFQSTINENQFKDDMDVTNLLNSIITRLKESEEELKVNKKNILNEARKIAKEEPDALSEAMYYRLKAEIKNLNIK